MAVKPPPANNHSPKTPARQPRPAPASKTPIKSRPPRNNERFAHDLFGVGLVALGLILLVSLILQHRGHAGLLGDLLVEGLRLAVGIGAWVFPFVLGAVGVMLIQGKETHTRTNFAGGAGLAFVLGIAWWQLGHTPFLDPFRTPELYGGFVGALISAGLRRMVGDISSHILLFAFAVGALVWATDMRLLHIFDRAVEGGRRVSAPVTQGARDGAMALKERAKRPPRPQFWGSQMLRRSRNLRPGGRCRAKLWTPTIFRLCPVSHCRSRLPRRLCQFLPPLAPPELGAGGPPRHPHCRRRQAQSADGTAGYSRIARR